MHIFVLHCIMIKYKAHIELKLNYKNFHARAVMAPKVRGFSRVEVFEKDLSGKVG